MRILFLTDNFPPEVNAPASRTYEHCVEWVKSGAEVTVVTCAPNFPKGKVYDGYRNKLYQKEIINGIKVIRVWTYIVPNKGFFKRTLDYISFSITGFLASLFVKTDLIVATSPQFFTALAGRALHTVRRKRWVMEVRDLWPESIKTVGAMKDSLFIRYFEWQEKRCYKKAWKIVVVTDSFKSKLISKGVDASKIFVVKNGVNKDMFSPMPKNMELKQELGLEGKRVVGYIGTHGMAHKLDFILRCAKSLESDDSLRFIFIGDGAKKEELLKLHKELDCKNVLMLDSVSKDKVKDYISILDVCLINLKKSPLFTTVLPSKIFENAAMEIPILMGVEGEAQSLIEHYHAGLCFEPENELDFRSKLTSLLDSEEYERCQKGCRALSADFDRKALAHNMLEILKDE